MQHWLLWAQHHGLDPDIIVPAPLLLPEPQEGFERGVIGGEAVLRGADLALAGDLALQELVGDRSEEHTSELQSLMRISYAVFCLKKKKFNQLLYIIHHP